MSDDNVIPFPQERSKIIRAWTRRPPLAGEPEERMRRIKENLIRIEQLMAELKRLGPDKE